MLLSKCLGHGLYTSFAREPCAAIFQNELSNFIVLFLKKQHVSAGAPILKFPPPCTVAATAAAAAAAAAVDAAAVDDTTQAAE